MAYPSVFEELADFLASMNPDKILAFRTSKKLQSRLEQLLEKNKRPKGLTQTEQSEVEQFMLLEHIVSLAKASALKNLVQKQKK